MTYMTEKIRGALESKGINVYDIPGLNAVRVSTHDRSFYFYDEFVHVKILITDLHLIDYSKTYKSLDETLKYIESFDWMRGAYS